MELRLRFRDLEPTDLSDLDWSGGSEHLGAVAAALEAATPATSSYWSGSCRTIA